MATPIAQYVAQLQKCIEGDYTGEMLQSLLSLSDSSQLVYVIRSLEKSGNLRREIDSCRKLSPNWSAIAEYHLRALLYYGKNWVSCFQAQVSCLSEMVYVIKDFDKRICPALVTLAQEAYRVGAKADDEAIPGTASEINVTFTLLSSAVRDAFSACNSHKPSENEIDRHRKYASIPLANILFKLDLRNVSSSSNTIAQLINSDDWIAKTIQRNGFSKADLVTYKFLSGKLNINTNRKEAQQLLSYALHHCHKSATHNIRLILKHLIPLRLHMGLLPSEKLLQRYNLLNMFGGIIAGVRDGNITAFRRNADKYQLEFIKCGIYLLVEQLQPLVYRQLLRKIITIIGDNKIRLDVLLGVLNSPDITPAELQLSMTDLYSFLSNLIARSIIAAYINYEPPFLVFPKHMEKAFGKFEDMKY